MQRYAERSASTKSKSSKATPSGMGSVLPHPPKSFSAVSVQSLSACCVLNAVYNHVMFCVNRALRAFGEQYMGASNSGIEGRASDDQNQNDSGEELGEDDGMQYYSKRKSAEPVTGTRRGALYSIMTGTSAVNPIFYAGLACAVAASEVYAGLACAVAAAGAQASLASAKAATGAWRTSLCRRMRNQW